MKPRILVVSPYYHPGRDAGGPIKSLRNIARFLLERGHRVDVVTKDRDFGHSEPFPGIPVDHWVSTSFGRAWYSSSLWTTVRGLREACRPGADAPVLYLNSFCSVRFSIIPVLLARAGVLSPQRILIAPRGEFVPSALAHKPRRKRLYLVAARLLGLYRGVVWHATNAQEAVFVRETFGPGADIRVAANLGDIDPVARADREPKLPGTVRMAFVARVIRIKNLDVAIRALAGARGSISFDVYGPIEDPAYWRECEELAAQLPERVAVRWKGVLDSERVRPALAGYDLFFLPTQGENFGHAILEAMQAGCPVLISDRTPWRGLSEAGAGWDLPLGRPEAFSEAISEIADLGEEAWRARSRAVTSYLEGHPLVRESLEQNARLFDG